MAWGPCRLWCGLLDTAGHPARAPASSSNHVVRMVLGWLISGALWLSHCPPPSLENVSVNLGGKLHLFSSLQVKGATDKGDACLPGTLWTLGVGPGTPATRIQTFCHLLLHSLHDHSLCTWVTCLRLPCVSASSLPPPRDGHGHLSGPFLSLSFDSPALILSSRHL